MTGYSNFDKDKHRDRDLTAVCARCDQQTRHVVLASVNERYRDDDQGVSVDVDYNVIRCQGCEMITFATVRYSTEDYDERHAIIPYIEFYPRRVEGRKPLHGALSLPNSVYNIYEETHTAFSNGQWILATVGIRTIIEAVCHDREMVNLYGYDYEWKVEQEPELREQPSDSLRKLLERLRADGTITKQQCNILHRTVDLGNIAVHRAEAAPQETLMTAMNIVEHVLREIYVLPNEVKQAYGRRQR